MKRFRYSQQWIDNSDVNEVAKTLKSDFLTQGPKVKEFETNVAAYCRAKYAVAFSSATAALHAACFVAGIGLGDEVIVPTYTFVASANCVIYCQGRPVLVDVDPSTLCIDPKSVNEKINKKTKAIISVDFAGRAANYDSLLKIAKKNKLVLIEDASQAVGGAWDGKPIGSFADMTVFSFHPVKTITTGEGGMVVTSSKRYFENLKQFRSHGIVKTQTDGPWHQEMQTLGYNYRLSDIHAALGVSQMKKIDKFINKRRKIAKMYESLFSKVKGIETPLSSNESAWHLYVVKLKNKVVRKKLFTKLHENNILVQVHYLPIHLNPYYRGLGYQKGDLPVSEETYERVISLPIYPQMSESDVRFIAQKVKNLLS